MSVSRNLTISVNWNSCAKGQLISTKLVNPSTKCSQRLMTILVNLMYLDKIGQFEHQVFTKNIDNTGQFDIN